MGKPKFLTEDVRRLVAEGWDISRIAQKYKVTYNAVRLRVHKDKIPYTFDIGRNRIEVPKLKELLAAGWRAGDIARHYNFDYRHVWHYIRKLDIPYAADRSGRYNGAWNGGRRKSGDYVYIWCPDHPHATQAGCVLESRLVMELKLGRYLLPTEVVHHKLGFDNTPENLKVYKSNGEHLAETLKGKIPRWTPAGRRRILEAIRQPRGPHKKATHAKSKKRDLL